MNNYEWQLNKFVLQHPEYAGERKSGNLTLNLFCDILRKEPPGIVAESNLPHDLDRIGLRLASSWTLAERREAELERRTKPPRQRTMTWKSDGHQGMNVFEAVKENVTAREAAGRYGIKVGRNGMACCPFHSDRYPSMKLDRRAHCFGCGFDGDAIDFAGKLFGLNPKEAAEKIASDFGIQYDHYQGRPPNRKTDKRRPSVAAKLQAAKEYQKAENRIYRVLCEYSHLLHDWKERYAPEAPEDEWHPLFAEALGNISHVEYLLDTLLDGSIAERAAIVKEKGKEVTRLEQRISELASGGTGGRDAGDKGDGRADTGRKRAPARDEHERAV